MSCSCVLIPSDTTRAQPLSHCTCRSSISPWTRSSRSTCSQMSAGPLHTALQPTPIKLWRAFACISAPPAGDQALRQIQGHPSHRALSLTLSHSHSPSHFHSRALSPGSAPNFKVTPPSSPCSSSFSLSLAHGSLCFSPVLSRSVSQSDD